MKPIGDMELPPVESIRTSAKIRLTEGGLSREVCRYIDLPLCFDCETYSFTVLTEDGGKEKRAVMWAWGLAIGEECYLGRTWPDFVDAIDRIVEEWRITPEHRCIIWVHNLSYDFQFFRKWFRWANVFALSSREVCYALTEAGVEFRCSYILTGYSLEKVGEHLTAHTMRKLSGTILYDIPRHPGTPLTDEEVAYLEHDCLVVTAHIAEQIEIEGGLSRIPLTKTGYVRRDVKKACFRDPTKKASEDMSKIRYGSFIHGLTMDPFIYDSLHRAFAGGFTHANPFHSGEVQYDVASYDFASAYPAVMVSEFFPATPPQIYEPKDREDFFKCLKLYCCVFTVTLKDLEPKVNFDHYLSSSHCSFPPGALKQLDNGRVVRASELTTTITNIDWEILIRCYHVRSEDYGKAYTVTGLIRWGKGYLPRPIVQCVIRYFQAKTQLKGIKGQEQEYMTAKENLNSIYGMMVTNPLRPLIPYDLEANEWGGDAPDGRRVLELPLTETQKMEALYKYNEGMSRFTYYAWGVFVTAYCRKNLWRGILHFGDDYVYADTDSIKVLHADDPAHRAHIERHNEVIQQKIKACLRYHGMDENLSVAKGKRLGIWEYEGTYTRFKSLGAKRYMVETIGKAGGPAVSLTVSGINKREAIPYILAQTAGPKRNTPEGGGDPFEYFDREMDIPAGHAGKMIPYYGDTMITGKLRDRFGNIYEYLERSYVYLEAGGYTLSQAGDYVMYLDMLRKGLI